MTHQVHRFHDICAGHRVVGHENKCRHLHGHNYRIHFTCEAENLDSLGRVIDFSVVKQKLCMWVEKYWDHKFLAYVDDPLLNSLKDGLFSVDVNEDDHNYFKDSIVWVPFNPTAENMAEYLVNVVGPKQLQGTGVRLVKVLIEETAKCHASYEV